MLSKRALKLGILRVIEANGPGVSVDKTTVIGFAVSQGQGLLERFSAFGPSILDPEDRALASIAYDELRVDDLIRPTFHDALRHESQCAITPRGRTMLARSLLDDLDEALAAIDPSLVERRDAAHDRARSSAPDATSHTALSCRRLIDEVLRSLAPLDEVRSQDWFEPDPDADSGVTRRHRVRLLLQKRGRAGEEDVEETSQEVISAVQMLNRPTHGSRGTISAPELVTRTEIALKLLLLG